MEMEAVMQATKTFGFKGRIIKASFFAIPMRHHPPLHQLKKNISSSLLSTAEKKKCEKMEMPLNSSSSQLLLALFIFFLLASSQL
jgi:hypothetical protein